MVRIAITGVCGKMGATILRLALEDADLSVVGFTETKGHPQVGKRPDAMGMAAGGPVISDDLSAAIDEADVVIDFSAPDSSIQHLKLATAGGKGIVIGTTGFSDDNLEEIRRTPGIKAVVSPNMSVGMNLMFDAVEKLSAKMKDDYDIEIVEMHHRLKKDAPSGTALKLKEIIEMSEPNRRWLEVYGREGILGPRKKEELAVLSLRGGDVVGEHTVIFAGTGERLEITHRAYSRDNFARGAILASKWLASQDRGLYTMKDVLGI